MKKVSTFCCERRAARSGAFSSWQSHAGKKVEAGERYYIRDMDLRKIHRAACSGNVPEVQRLLLLRPGRLNDTDRRKR